jgi:uncharacterized protein (DUF488 family)
MKVFTIGHSNHPLEAFRDLLQRHAVQTVVDVRSSPYSQYCPHFDREALHAYLNEHGVAYRFLGDALGGRPPDDSFYDERGRVLYDQVAASPAFRQGIDRLIREARRHRVAVLCGEEDPTECHRRRLVGRVLTQRGLEVIHIRGDGRAQTEEELARDEHLRKTGGQLTLFEIEEADPWRSTRSVSRERPLGSFSGPSSGPESAESST